jgi:hypothetical protein
MHNGARLSTSSAHAQATHNVKDRLLTDGVLCVVNSCSYSDAWGFVTVPTDVKTCYVVYVMVPNSVSAEALVDMVDVEKVDMRFSSRTDCAAGQGANGGWKTELEFKTYVCPTLYFL